MIYALVAAVIAVVALLALRLRRKAAVPEMPILIDGSNVMYWDDLTPNIGSVADAIAAVAAKGFTAYVVFDANAGHLLYGRYLDDAALAVNLGLPNRQVLVVGKGVQADPYLLAAARDSNARVVSNDQFRDWAKIHPEVRRKGHLVHGGYKSGKLWLDFDGSRPRDGARRRRRKF